MTAKEEVKSLYYVLNEDNRIIGLSEQGDEDKFFAKVPINVDLSEIEISLGIKEKYIEFREGAMVEISQKDLEIMGKIDVKIALAISEVIDMIINGNEET